MLAVTGMKCRSFVYKRLAQFLQGCSRSFKLYSIGMVAKARGRAQNSNDINDNDTTFIHVELVQQILFAIKDLSELY